MDKRLVPEPVAGYELFQGTTHFYVVIPEATRNMISNPSFETGTTGYTAVGATISRSMNYQVSGDWSLRVVTTAANQGVKYAVAVTSGQTYTFSMSLRGTANYEYRVGVLDGSSNPVTSKVVTAIGGWQRISLTFTATASTNWSVYVYCIDAVSDTFYTDAWQVENKAYATTYCDGSMSGYVIGETAYAWEGQKHASPSIRASTTASGGREVDLYDLGFHIMAVNGLGMPPVENITTELAGGGEFYQKTRYGTRYFSLVGFIAGNNYLELNGIRNNLVEAFRPTRTAYPQPLLLRYRYEGGGTYGINLDLKCLYESGLEGAVNNLYQERIEIRFRMPDPMISSTYVSGSQEIGLTSAVNPSTSNYYAFKIDPDGTWTPVNYNNWNKPGAQPYAIHRGFCGTMSPGGRLIIANDTGSHGLSYLDNTTLTPIGAGFDSSIHDICITPDGTIFVCGDFTNAYGGSPKLSGVAKYDGSSWSSVGGNTLLDAMTNGSARQIEVMPNGDVYVLAMDGSGPDWGLYKSTGYGAGAWSLVSTYTNALNYGRMEYSSLLGQLIFAGGTALGGVSSTYGVYKYNGTTFTAISTGLTAYPGNFDILNDGSMYISTASNGVWKFNGSAWVKINNGFNQAHNTRAGFDGMLYFYSATGAWNTLPTIDGVSYTADEFVLMGNTIYPLAWAATAGSTISYVDATDFVVMPDKTKYINAVDYGVDTGEGIKSFQALNVVNCSEANANPEIYIVGPYTLYYIRNITTGRAMYFNNFVVNAGESVTIKFGAGRSIAIISDQRGDISSKVSSGTTSDFYLTSGDNRLEIAQDFNYAVYGDSAGVVKRVFMTNLSYSQLPSRTLYISSTYVAPNYKFFAYADSGRTQLVCSAALDDGYMKSSGSYTVSGIITRDALSTTVTTTAYVVFGAMVIRWRKQIENILEAFA